MSSGRRNINVHPLAIASICDHFTRIQMGGSKSSRDSPALGILLGTQDGLEVSVFDAVDVVYVKLEDGRVSLDKAEITKKKDLTTAVFTKMELIGWYIVALDLSDECAHVHYEMKEFNVSPLFLLLNPSLLQSEAGQTEVKQLPLAFYETEVCSTDPTKEIFVDIPFKLETSQVECIAVDEVVKFSPSEGISSLETQNYSSSVSLKTISSKIDLLISIMQDMSTGARAVDHTLLRKISNICPHLPAIDSESFKQSFQNTLSDGYIMSYLAASTKATSSLNELTERYSSAYSEGWSISTSSYGDYGGLIGASHGYRKGLRKHF